MKWWLNIKGMVAPVLDFFYPLYCETCGRRFKGDEKVLCLHCLTALPLTGFHQVEDNPALRIFTGRVRIARACSFLYFSKKGMVQHLLHRFKYKGRQEIGRYLGQLFAAELKESGWLDGINGIVAVPLHRRKKIARGYNQADLLAEGLSEISGIPVLRGMIQRTRHTQTQTYKNRVERLQNVEDAFRLTGRVEGMHVLIVDDVITTGATLEAVAKALMGGKAAALSVATIAMATD